MSRAPFTRLASLPRPWRLALFGLSCCAVAAASYIELTPGGPPGPLLGYLLNFLHAPLFGILALGFLLALGGAAPRRAWGWLLTLGFVLAAGIADEWHQTTLSHRSSDLADVGTDLLGALSTLVLANWGSREPGTLRAGLGRLSVCLAVVLLWVWAVVNMEPHPLPLLDGRLRACLSGQ